MHILFLHFHYPSHWKASTVSSLQPKDWLFSSSCKDWYWLPWYQPGIVTTKRWYCFLSQAPRDSTSMSVSCKFWYVLPAMPVSIYSCQWHDFIRLCDIPDNTTLKITLALTWAAGAFRCTSGCFWLALFATCSYSDWRRDSAAAVSTNRWQVLHAKAP